MRSAPAVIPPAYPIASVDSALRLLLAFRDCDSLRVADASAILGVGRSTAHRLLAMLQYHGLVQQDRATKAYRVGPVLWDLGLAVVQRLDIRTQLRGCLERITASTGETSHLLTLHGAECRVLVSVECGEVLRTVERVGVTYPAHAAAAGKALLAELSRDELRALYPSTRISRVGRATITSRARLEEELERVREDGYATTFGDAEADVAAVAVPVRAADGKARAAIAVAGPIWRMRERDLPALAADMTREVARGPQIVD